MFQTHSPFADDKLEAVDEAVSGVIHSALSFLGFISCIFHNKCVSINAGF